MKGERLCFLKQKFWLEVFTVTKIEKEMKTQNGETTTSSAEFSSQKNPSAKIILEFSSEEKNAQRDFVNILKNLYIQKFQREMKNGD